MQPLAQLTPVFRSAAPFLGVVNDKGLRQLSQSTVAPLPISLIILRCFLKDRAVLVLISEKFKLLVSTVAKNTILSSNCYYIADSDLKLILSSCLYQRID